MLLEIILLILSTLPDCLCVDLTYYVEEGKSPGTLVGDIAANSHFMDTVPPQDHHLITFSQLQQGVPGSAQLFRVSKRTGKLYTAQTLDAESMCRFNTECFEIVKVAVRRAETFMRIQKIKVVIQDVNDQQPQFPEKQISIEFSERDGKGTMISIPNAVDRDVAIANSRIAYQLKKSKDEPFTLIESKRVYGKSKLAIRLEDRLNRERKDSYVVQVLAKDGGTPPKQSFLDVHISVRDENDNAPTFSQSEYNVSVKNEHYGSLPIFTLSASDSDSGKNGKVTYHFSPDTSEVAKTHFKLNEVTGEIFLRKKFATGQQLTYKLFVEATDDGSPPLSSIALVQVNLVNQENNPPNIDINFISASVENRAVISEDIKVGSFIAYVMVTDHDAGLNGEVLCDLSHHNFQLQSLGSKEYKVTVKNPLDRETKDYHDITIRCQDKGSPPLYSKNKFSIKVMDVNDVRPQFSKDVYKFSVYENQKSKFPVGSISTTDPDLGPGGKLTYFLQTNNEQFLPFQISDDGLISTVLSLDYEFQDIYNFKVLVKDSGSPPLNNTVDVIVDVRDENDNAPYFTFPSVNPFSMEVHYHPDNINNITVLKASDKDSRENAYLKYEITGGNDKQLFNINRYTGLLSFTREPTQLDAGSYELHFVVKDSGSPVLSAKTTLLLMVTVSSKTPAEILNVVHMKSDDNIQMYLLIVIVFVAVTVSVAIAAPISICIIRCYEQRNMSHAVEVNPYDKCVTDQGNLTSQSHLAISWPDVAVAIRKDSNTSWSTLPTKTKEPFSADGFGGEQHRSGSGIKFQTATEVVYETGDRSVNKWCKSNWE